MKYYRLKMCSDYRYCVVADYYSPFLYCDYHREWTRSRIDWSSYLPLFHSTDIVEISKLEVLVVCGSVPE